MVTYEVTASVPAAHVAAYERYMRERHIPDLLRTGCFVRASIATSAPGRYRIRYEAPDQAALERYLAAHAPRLRADFAAHMGADVRVEREVWTTLEAWDAPPA